MSPRPSPLVRRLSRTSAMTCGAFPIARCTMQELPASSRSDASIISSPCLCCLIHLRRLLLRRPHAAFETLSSSRHAARPPSRHVAPCSGGIEAASSGTRRSLTGLGSVSRFCSPLAALTWQHKEYACLHPSSFLFVVDPVPLPHPTSDRQGRLHLGLHQGELCMDT
jgi:hypothetical protein